MQFCSAVNPLKLAPFLVPYAVPCSKIQKNLNDIVKDIEFVCISHENPLEYAQHRIYGYCKSPRCISSVLLSGRPPVRVWSGVPASSRTAVRDDFSFSAGGAHEGVDRTFPNGHTDAMKHLLVACALII